MLKPAQNRQGGNRTTQAFSGCLPCVAAVYGNIGHIQPLPGRPVLLVDRLTAATSPIGVRGPDGGAAGAADEPASGHCLSVSRQHRPGPAQARPPRVATGTASPWMLACVCPLAQPLWIKPIRQRPMETARRGRRRRARLRRPDAGAVCRVPYGGRGGCRGPQHTGWRRPCPRTVAGPPDPPSCRPMPTPARSRTFEPRLRICWSAVWLTLRRSRLIPATGARASTPPHPPRRPTGCWRGRAMRPSFGNHDDDRRRERSKHIRFCRWAVIGTCHCGWRRPTQSKAQNGSG